MTVTPLHPSTSTYRLIGPRDDLLTDKDADAIRERIQSLLAQWLRMENVTLLIGAGASKSQRGALITELEMFALNAMEKLCATDPLKSCACILESRKKALTPTRSTSITFEQWLSHLTNAAYILNAAETPISSVTVCGTTTISPSDFNAFLRVMAEVIFMRCSLLLPRVTGTADVTGHHALMAKLIARDPALGRTSMFTTNYDTLIEQALDDLAIQYADGFIGTVQRRFDPSCYGVDLYYPGDITAGRVRRFDKYVHLYKLHGSVHWRREGREVIQVSDPRLGLWDKWENKPADEMRRDLDMLFPRRECSLGILPTECKFVETLGLPYAHVFRAFHQRLQEPQTFLLVIGYSFADDHINRIIDDAMTNPSLVLLVVDPSPTKELIDRITRYRDTGERAFLLTSTSASTESALATFDDFAKNLMPNVQWLSDFVSLRRTEHTLQGASANVSTASAVGQGG